MKYHRPGLLRAIQSKSDQGGLIIHCSQVGRGVRRARVVPKYPRDDLVRQVSQRGVSDIKRGVGDIQRV